MNNLISINEYDILADLRINFFCNFNCEYCFTPLKYRKNPKYLNPKNIDKIIKFFKKTDLKFCIHLSGGEPFLSSDFIRLCGSLTKNHYISLNTNLTTNSIYDFAKKINPKKVESINCSLHITERERLNLKEDFIKKFKTLEKKGFNVFVSQVMHPKIIKKFDNLFYEFKKVGITIIPKVFRGIYNEKKYPLSYTEKEKAEIQRFKKISERTHKIQEPISKILSFKGLPCSAGNKFFIINYDGTIRRCLNDNTYLGNIFKGDLKLLDGNELCISEICNCPYFGLTYTSKFFWLSTKRTLDNFLEKSVYPYTTPKFKPIKRIIKKFFYNSNKK